MEQKKSFQSLHTCASRLKLATLCSLVTKADVAASAFALPVLMLPVLAALALAVPVLVVLALAVPVLTETVHKFQSQGDLRHLVMEQKKVFSPSRPVRKDSSSQPSVRWLQKLTFGRAGSLPVSAMICAAITWTSGGV